MTKDELQQAIASLSYQECASVRELIEERINDLQTKHVEQLREKWREEAAAVGLDPEEFFDGRRMKKGRGRSGRNGHATA